MQVRKRMACGVFKGKFYRYFGVELFLVVLAASLLAGCTSQPVAVPPQIYTPPPKAAEPVRYPKELERNREIAHDLEIKRSQLEMDPESWTVP